MAGMNVIPHSRTVDLTLQEAAHLHCFHSKRWYQFCNESVKQTSVSTCGFQMICSRS